MSVGAGFNLVMMLVGLCVAGAFLAGIKAGMNF